jgi:hypothetical protein
MAYAAGIALAFIVVYFGRATALDRDRAFYPTLVIVIASYYVLFALMAGSLQTLLVESVVMSAFVLGAVIGFKRNAWLVVACLAAHGTFDIFHASITANPGVPDWWPAFCLAFDVGAAGLLALLLLRWQRSQVPDPV